MSDAFDETNCKMSKEESDKSFKKYKPYIWLLKYLVYVSQLQFVKYYM